MNSSTFTSGDQHSAGLSVGRSVGHAVAFTIIYFLLTVASHKENLSVQETSNFLSNQNGFTSHLTFYVKNILSV